MYWYLRGLVKFFNWLDDNTISETLSYNNLMLLQIINKFWGDILDE